MKIIKKLYKNHTYNLALVIKDFLRYYELNIPYETIKSSLREHPFAYSIESIKVALKSWGMDCIVLEGNKEILPSLNYPCMIHLNGKKGNCFIIEKIEGEFIYINYPTEGQRKHAINRFIQEKGEFILIVPNSINENKYKNSINQVKSSKKEERRKKIIFTLIASLLSFILISSIINQHSTKIILGYTIFLALSILGLYVGYLIQNVELAIYKNKILTLICTSGKGQSNSCSNIINSKGSKFLGIVSLGDLVIVYFSSYIIVSCHYMFIKDPYDWIVLTTFLCVLSIPFITYSIIYQIRKKEYCFLCISVDIILIVKLLIASYFISNINVLGVNYIDLIYIMFWYGAISLIIWVYFKRIKETKIRDKEYVDQYIKLRKRFDVFNCLIEKSKKVHHPIQNSELTIENSKSKISIIIWLSFSCPSCAETYRYLINSSIFEIAEITIRFHINEIQNPLYKKISQKLIALVIEKKKTEAINELSKWYRLFLKDNSINIWLKDSSKVHEKSLKEANTILDLYSSWYNSDSIIGTPTIIWENKIVPNFYHIKDIIFFLENNEL